VNAVSVRLLGPLELERAGRLVAFGGRAQRALLARLLLDANRTVAVDRLVEDLWGEAAPASSSKMVQIYVSKLRKELPEDMLVTRAPGYALEIDAEALDLVRFERLREEGRAALAGGFAATAADRLREALALWRGPALEEFREPFAVVEAARLEELRLSSLEDRIDADLVLGRHAGLDGELEALVARNPWRERLWGQLMLARYRTGRQADALAGYRRVREMLATELGIEPSAMLRDLERRILQQDPALDLATAARHPHRRPVAPERPGARLRHSTATRERPLRPRRHPRTSASPHLRAGAVPTRSPAGPPRWLPHGGSYTSR
jgi:DNA-binding SARP family transcriptional activator